MTHTIPVTFKVLILGANNIGKTSAVQRFIDKKFVSQLHPTIGVDFSLKSIPLTPDATNSIPDSAILQLWDIGGEKKFQTIIPYYIAGTQGLLFACDSTNPSTLDRLEEFLEFIINYLDIASIPSILISTKHDLSTILNKSDIEKFMHKHAIQEYFPTSAVNGLNIDLTFQRIGQLIAEKLASLGK